MVDQSFNPPAKGNQWGLGAVFVRSMDRSENSRMFLQSVGIKSSAKYIGYYGADIHLSGNPEKNGDLSRSAHFKGAGG